VTVLDLDVVLTDYLVGTECLCFAVLSKNNKGALFSFLFFLSVAISAFLGGTYHGFFPLKTSTASGFLIWICTLAGIGGTAVCLWHFLTGSIKISLVLWLAFIFYVSFIDHRFWVAVIFYLLPLTLFIFTNAKSYWKHPNTQARWGVIAGLTTLVASIFQQRKIGIDPHYFDHNALYHLLEMAALLCFYFCFKPVTALRI